VLCGSAILNLLPPDQQLNCLNEFTESSSPPPRLVDDGVEVTREVERKFLTKVQYQV